MLGDGWVYISTLNALDAVSHLQLTFCLISIYVFNRYIRRITIMIIKVVCSVLVTQQYVVSPVQPRCRHHVTMRLSCRRLPGHQRSHQALPGALRQLEHQLERWRRALQLPVPVPREARAQCLHIRSGWPSLADLAQGTFREQILRRLWAFDPPLHGGVAAEHDGGRVLGTFATQRLVLRQLGHRPQQSRLTREDASATDLSWVTWPAFCPDAFQTIPIEEAAQWLNSWKKWLTLSDRMH